MPGARHGGHEWGLICYQDVVIFIDDGDVVGYGYFWCGDAVEEDIDILAEHGTWLQGSLIAQDHLARGKSLAQCLCIIIGVAVALGGDDFAEKIPGAKACLRRAHARRVEPIFDGQRGESFSAMY